MSADAALKALSRWMEWGAPARKAVEALRIASDRWPSWCYVPRRLVLAAILMDAGVPAEDVASFSKGDSPDARFANEQAAIASVLAPWRMTKGVYRFDPDLMAALWETPITGSIPGELLKRLPEWCVFLPIPPTPIGPKTLIGAFANLDYAPDEHAAANLVLTFMFENPDEIDMFQCAIPLDTRPFGEALDAALQPASNVGRDRVGEQAVTYYNAARQTAGRIASLVLYLCSEAPEVDGIGKPGNPRPTKTKKGMRTFAAAKVRTWNVGVRIGAALRKGREASGREEGSGGSTGRSVRPHVRRAHWHTYWTGPRRGEQTPVLRWLHPTLVNAELDDVDNLPTVVRPVKGEPDE